MIVILLGGSACGKNVIAKCLIWILRYSAPYETFCYNILSTSRSA